MYVLYAFARITDDLGDRALEPEKILPQLSLWRELVCSSLACERLPPSTAQDPVLTPYLEILPALIDTSHQFEIPQDYLVGIIDGVIADQVQTRFANWDELHRYCYLVASTVGLSCMHVWGFQPPLRVDAGIQCGIAFQLTNILRDITEDAARNRIYLPTELWQPLGITEQDLLQAQTHPQIPLVMKRVADAAREHYASGWQVMDSLHDDGQRMFSMMWRTYRALLMRIESNPQRALHQRTHVPLATKAWIAATHATPWTFRLLQRPNLRS
jgi:phytoene synthase